MRFYTDTDTDIFDNLIINDHISTIYGDFILSRHYFGISEENATGCRIELTADNTYDHGFIINTIFGYLENTATCDNLTTAPDAVTFDDFSTPTHTANTCEKIRVIINALDTDF